MFLIIYVLDCLAFISWILILFFLKNKSPKSTSDIVKLITLSTIIVNTLLTWTTLIILNFEDPAKEAIKLIICAREYSFSQMANAVLLFNIYSFAFDYRHPQIDPNLPHWITCILGVSIPLFVTFLTFTLDKSMSLFKGPDLVKYMTDNQGER